MVNKIKSNSLSYFDLLNIIPFVLYTIFYEYIIVNYDMGTSIGSLRYYFLLFVLLVSFVLFLISRKYRKRAIIGKEILLLFIPSIVFLILSILIAVKVNMFLELRTIVQIMMFLLPALYAFVLINNFEIQKIYTLLKCATIITILFYFTEPHHTLTEFLKISNWMKMSLVHSVSFTESHNFFDTFLQLFLFFNYYACKETDRRLVKNLNKYRIITGIFTFLSFKRLGVLFLFFMLIYTRFNHDNLKLTKKSNVVIIAMLITGITVFYTKVLQGEIFDFSYDTLFNFTSGRKWYIEIWKSKNYFSYGYGTSIYVIGRFLEMDLVQIYIELGGLCVFLFCYTFIKIAYKNKYSLLIMLYVMANMITSSSLPWTYGWIVMFITTASISSNIKVNNINQRKRKYLIV